jgi:hypothetical protein
MSGRQRIQAALSPQGSGEIPAVICYEGIFTRDHWSQLTAHPWWVRFAPDIERQMAWRRDAFARVNQDWFQLPGLFYSREDRGALTIEARDGDSAVRLVDRRNGNHALLTQPPIGGEHISISPASGPKTIAEIDAAVPLPRFTDRFEDYVAEPGRADLARSALGEFGASHFAIWHVDSPMESCFFDLWAFEEAMINVVRHPELVEHACRRFLERSLDQARLAARLGAAGCFVEDCMTDMVSPQAFATFNVPYARRLVDEIRALGMQSVYYFCGNPSGKWDLLMSIGADALSLEESKKGFHIDVEDVVDRVQGRCAVLGNLDAVGVLQDGSEEQLRAEIRRQIAAGRRNGNRFVMSIGSPVTPGTPVERVRLYCDLVHELGRA